MHPYLDLPEDLAAAAARERIAQSRALYQQEEARDAAAVYPALPTAVEGGFHQARLDAIRCEAAVVQALREMRACEPYQRPMWRHAVRLEIKRLRTARDVEATQFRALAALIADRGPAREAEAVS